MPKRIYFFTLLPASVALLLFLNYKERNAYYLTIKKIELTEIDSVRPVTDSLVAPILYNGVKGIIGLSPEDAKQAFISIMLPSILMVKYKISLDMERIKELKEKEVWSTADSLFFEEQGDYYKTFDHNLLIRRMRTHPNSIILAQAAVESGWGSSRFFTEANNAFGIWSYRADEPRIRASYTRAGNPVYLRKYPDLAASVYDYFGVVARARAYRQFRLARDTTDNLEVLLPLLRYYSEKREEYVTQLETIIRQNNLTLYDTYQLDHTYFIKVDIFSLFGYDIDTTISAATFPPEPSAVQFDLKPARLQ